MVYVNKMIIDKDFSYCINCDKNNILWFFIKNKII